MNSTSAANVVPTPVDDVGDQKRMLLLPEKVGGGGFPRIQSPYVPKWTHLEKEMREDRTLVPHPGSRHQNGLPHDYNGVMAV
ncbi:hypothetical protein TNCV_2101511 [Trichonephila clavipes]|nr:hypothetical protein TNCV_2101511 [Trichonephila clavipes]